MTDSSPPVPTSRLPEEPEAGFDFVANVRRGLWTFSGFFALDLLFWFVGDFRKFAPPSDGPFIERIFFALVTSAGPVAWMSQGNDLPTAFTVVVMGTVVPIAVCGFAGRGCFSAGARFAGFGIWFVLGFMMAGMRIT